MAGRRRSRGEDGASTPAGAGAGAPAASAAGPPSPPAGDAPAGDPLVITVGPAAGTPALPHWTHPTGRGGDDAGTPPAALDEAPAPIGPASPVETAPAPAGPGGAGTDAGDEVAGSPSRLGRRAGARGASGRRGSSRRAPDPGEGSPARRAGLSGAVPSGLPPSGDGGANGTAAPAHRFSAPARIRAGAPGEPGASGPPAAPAAPAASTSRAADGRAPASIPAVTGPVPSPPVPGPASGGGAAGTAPAPPADERRVQDPPAAPTARWRGANEDWGDGSEAFADLHSDDDTHLGALDERDRLLDEQYLTFEDLDVPRADMPTVPPRGSADDPIRIQRAGGVFSGGTTVAAVAGTDAEGDEPADAGPPADPSTAAGPAPSADAPGDGAVVPPPVAATSHRARRSPGPDPTDAPRRRRRRCRPRARPVLRPRPRPGHQGGGGHRHRRAGRVPGGGVHAAALAAAGARGGGHRVRHDRAVQRRHPGRLQTAQPRRRGRRRGTAPAGLPVGYAHPARRRVGHGAGAVPQPGRLHGLVPVRGGPGSGRSQHRGHAAGHRATSASSARSPRSSCGRARGRAAAPTVDQGIPLIILVVVGTELYDAGGYLLGSRLGRTPLSAASPSKTREGLVAGHGLRRRLPSS